METEKPKEVARLSYKIAHILTTKTALHAYSAHRLLGAQKQKETESMDTGKLLEKFVLGCDLDKLTVLAFDNWQSKSSKEARAFAEMNGQQAVLQKHFEEANEAAVIMQKRFKDKGVDLAFKGSDKVKVFTQLRIEWTSPEGVLCSGVIDRLELDYQRTKATIYDYKTSADLSTKALQRSVFNYGYATQQNSYEEAVGVLYPAFLGRIQTIFLFSEKEEPFAVRPLHLAGSMTELGRRAWREAKERWAECMASGIWPDYPNERLEATAWMLDESLKTELMSNTDFELKHRLEAA